MSGTPLHASPRLALILLGAHAAAGGAAWISFGSGAGAAIALLAIAAGAFAINGRALLRAKDSPARLGFDAAGRLRIVDRIGREWIPVERSPRFVSRWLVIVAASLPAGAIRWMLVTRDMLLPEPFRKLRIWALWGAASGTARPGRPAN